MLPKRYYIFFALLMGVTCLLGGGLYAQTYTISGTIIDATSEEPIPFVNVYLKNSKGGTTSDFDGKYSFTVSSLDDSIIASSVGYDTKIKPLKNVATQTINFQLDRASINLAEIVIKPGINPAHPILEKIIANKPRNDYRTGLEYINYEAYNKVEMDMYNMDDKFKDRKVMRPFQFIFDNVDSTSEDDPYLPLFLSESLSDYYYRRDPEKEYELIKATKMSGLENESLSQFSGSLYQEVSIYDNWPFIMFKGFVSPIADQGLNYYRYYLIDSGYVDNHWCYKLNFVPKGKGSLTFIGDMWVVDSSWAIKKISMEAAQHVNINFIERIAVHQEFKPTKGDAWVMSKDKIVIKFKVSDKLMGVIGRKTTTFKDIQVNDPSIEQYLTERTDIEVQDSVFEQSAEFWRENRHEELSEQEETIYQMVDSLKNTRAFNNWVDVVNTAITGYFEAGPLEFGPYSSLYSVNSVESHRFRLGIRTSSAFSKTVKLGIFGAYGIGDERFKYGASFIWLLNKTPRASIAIDFSTDFDLKPSSQADVGQDNLLSGLARRQNILQKLMFVNQGGIDYHKEWVVGYSNDIGVRYRDMRPYFPFQYIMPGNEDDDEVVINQIKTAEASFNMRFAYREKFLTGDFLRTSLGSRYPIIAVKYTIGVEGIGGSQFNYHRIDMSLGDEFPINPIGTFNFDIFAGKIFGDLPYLLLEVHPGNETFFYSTYAFNLMNEYEFASDMYVAAIIRHHFDGFFFNKIPGIRKLKWRSLVTVKAVVGDLSSGNELGNRLNTVRAPGPTPYVEVGAGIENIFKLFRVDFIWRLTYRDNPNIVTWGIRPGLEINF